MIQRIQTIYLLLIALIAGLLIYIDPSFIEVQGFDKWTNNEKGFVGIRFNTVVMKAAGADVGAISLNMITYTLGVICLLATVSIFLFKNRKLQALLTAFNYIFILVLYILMSFYGYKYVNYVSQEVDIDVAIGLFFPLFLPVFNFMALSRINYDEMLVRSTDRLR